MTDQEWLACTDVEAMLRFASGKAKEQGLRRFALAWCRRVAPDYFGSQPPRLNDVTAMFAELGAEFHPDMWFAFSVVERFAAGQATSDELGRACRLANDWARVAASWDLGMYYAAASVANAAGNEPFIPPAAPYLQADWTADAIARDRSEQADLLREHVAPPSLWNWRLCSDWLTWNDGTVPRLAQTIHDDGRFDLLPILADALEEAGCTDAAVLEACRKADSHECGSWVVNLILDS